MITVNKKDFINALKFCIIGAGKKDVRYYLNTVLIEVWQGKLIIIGCDGHRIHKVEMVGCMTPAEFSGLLVGVEGSGNCVELNINRDSIERVIKGVDVSRTVADDETINLVAEGEALKPALKLSGLGFEMALEKSDGKFPDWRRVTPGADKALATGEIGFAVKYLGDIAKAFKLLATSSFPSVRMMFHGANMVAKITMDGGLKSHAQLSDPQIWLMPVRVKNDKVGE